MVYDTRQEMTDFFERKIKSGEYMQLIGTVDGEFTCTAGLLFQEYPPSISWKGAKRGYICNVYTRPEYRKKGYASILIKELIKEARQRDLGNLWLMASKEGRTLYKTLGFDDIR